MKTIALLSVLILGSLTSLSFGQVSKVWVQIIDQTALPVISVDGSLTSNNEAFNAAISTVGITKVTQALPASRQPKLQQVFEIECSCTQEDLTNTLSSIPVFAGIESAPNYQVLYTPNDYNLGLANNYALDLINAPSAWDITHGNASFIIGISDQNVNPLHEELTGKIVSYNPTNTAIPTHGNAVCAIAAGNTNNNTGLSSIGFNSSIAFYEMNYNNLLTATYSGIRVLNLSWTSGCFYNQYEQDVVTEVYNNGTFIIAAAGNGITCNSPDALVYPAAYAHVFAVTSIGELDNHEQVTGDPLSTHQHNQMVDLSAPGYNVAIAPMDGWYLNSSGTSYAAPYVTGTVALMLAVNPCLGNVDLETILKNTSSNIDALNPLYAGKIGSGRLNAAAAVLFAQSYNHEAIFNLDIQGSCASSSSAVSINPSNVTGHVSVAWSNGMVGLGNTGIGPGTYTLTLIDAIGCSSDTTFNVNTPVAVQVSGIVTPIQCVGQANGAIDVTVLQGNPAFTYAWDNGATSQDLTNLDAGTYRLTVIDANGCISYSSYTITQPSEIILNATVIDEVQGNDGAIDITIAGGVPSYATIWSNGVNTEDQTNLSAGTYEVTVVDGNGCMNSLTVVVANNQTNAISEQGVSNITVYPNPSLGNTTVQWNEAMEQLVVIDNNGRIVLNNAVNGINSFEINSLSSGIYLVNLYNKIYS
ncbi:MAG: S8 family serine peptidase [Flavobacteriales bacterium]